MIDLNSMSALSDRINYLIDSAIDTTAAESQQRDYLGASVVGHYCERHVQYHLLAARGDIQRKQPAARIMRIFDRGNCYEDKARRWLQAAGFIFSTQEHKFSTFEGRFRGHVDGVIVGFDGIPSPAALPLLWENKCLGSKNWKKLNKEKLKSYSSTYYAQVQVYMHMIGLERCLFTAVNADTMEIYHELVLLEATEATGYMDRVKRVILATDMGEMLPRCTGDQTFFQCRFCDFAGECWK